MKYLEITVITTTEASEIVAEVLSEEGSSGISVVDKNDLFELKKEEAPWDYIDGALESMDGYARVSGYFGLNNGDETIRNLHERFRQLKAGDYGVGFGPLETVTRVIDDADWIDVWKKHFKPITINGVTIVPEWLAGEAQSAADGGGQSTEKKKQKRIILNPGLAFGTGEHETTAMCIELLQRAPLSGRTVIDLGCGSGILGIAAAVLGAERVVMIDIDPLAVEAAALNAGLNAEENPEVKNIEVLQGNLFQRADIKGDVIVANLASALLISASKEIAEHLHLGGALILSGIIKEREEEVAKVYGDILGREAVREILRKGEWVALYIYA